MIAAALEIPWLGVVAVAGLLILLAAGTGWLRGYFTGYQDAREDYEDLPPKEIIPPEAWMHEGADPFRVDHH